MIIIIIVIMIFIFIIIGDFLVVSEVCWGQRDHGGLRSLHCIQITMQKGIEDEEDADGDDHYDNSDEEGDDNCDCDVDDYDNDPALHRDNNDKDQDD